MADHDGSDSSSPSEVAEVFAQLQSIGEDTSPKVLDFIEELGQASFGTLLLVPSMIIASPASGIPLLSSVGGLIIALIAIQMVFGRDHVWLPGWLMERSIDRQKYDRAMDFLRRPVRWLDRIAKPRLIWLLRYPTLLLLQMLCVICGLAMPFMEMLPFTSSIAAVAVLFVALSIISQDGLFALLGVFIALAGAFTVFKMASGVVSGLFG